jgi:uncharacterized protein YraI
MSMPKSIRWQLIAAFLLLAVRPASAQDAFTNRDVNLRSGPDRSFPLVSWMPNQTPVRIYGCLSDYRWCDVAYGPNRGWVYAGFLNYTYQNRPVVIYQSGPVLGFPIVTFSIGTYWDTYYRGRPWYRDRTRYYNWRPPPGRPYRPRPPASRPPSRPINRPRPPSGGRPPGGGKPGTNPPPRPSPRPPSTNPPSRPINRPDQPSNPGGKPGGGGGRPPAGGRPGTNPPPPGGKPSTRPSPQSGTNQPQN